MRTLLLVLSVLSLAACGSGDSPYGGEVPPPVEYSIAGEVSGLVGDNLILQLNGGSNLTLSASSGGNGSFQFSQTVVSGESYQVSILQMPTNPAQSCSLSNGSGVATAAVTNVVVTCFSTPAQAVTDLTYQAGLQSLTFSWTSALGASHYRLFGNDFAGGFVQIGGDITATNVTVDIASHQLDWAGGYYLESCNYDWGCASSDTIYLNQLDSPATIGYIKASNPSEQDMFGYNVAVSDDGSTMAVSAHGESSAATGINGDQNSESAPASGAVYLYRKNVGLWVLEAYIKASNAEAGDWFGSAVSLSADGNTLIVGAQGEDSAAATVNGDVLDNSADGAGAAYVFGFDGTSWSQQAYLKAFNSGVADHFGSSVSISNDGNWVAIGAPDETSGISGVFSDLSVQAAIDAGADNSLDDGSGDGAGAVYLFERIGGLWFERSYIKASDPASKDQFGHAISMSGNGLALAVGALNGGVATSDGGSAYLFVQDLGVWTEQQEIAPVAETDFDQFGYSVALDDAGDTLVVGAVKEASQLLGVALEESGISVSCLPAACPGAAYIFSYDGLSWSQQAFVKASNAVNAYDSFGQAVAISGDGLYVAVGAEMEQGGIAGVGGNDGDNSADQAGAAYLFHFDGASWQQRNYIKSINPTGQEFGDWFGQSVALSGDGSLLVVGAPQEDSADAANPSDNSLFNSGAAYFY